MALTSKPFFLGTFRHVLDVKNRLTIPSKWRIAGAENDESFVAIPQDGHWLVLPASEATRLYERSAEKNLSDLDAQLSMQKLYALSHQLDCDKQGRTGLPDEMLKHAAIDRDVVLVGGMSRFYLWAPDRWAKMDIRNTGENIGEVMRRMSV